MKVKDNKKIFFFMPLASVGGTESVHLDILKSLQDYDLNIFIRYSSNIWKGRAYCTSKKAKLEGKAMLSEFQKYGQVIFLDKFLDAFRFGRIIRKWYKRFLLHKINNSESAVVIFWHRESIDFIFDNLNENVKIIDIVHNNSNNEVSDAHYLVNDLVPKINCRILVSNGLKKWLEPLYTESNYSSELWNRIRVIEHCVHFPSGGSIQKSTEVFHVLFIGRDSIEKRFNLILQIAETVNNNFHFHFIGPEKEDYEKFKLKNSTWYGSLTNRNEIEEIYKKGHVLILTSSSEGFPKVISEAMAFSCVPIVTDVGDISSHVKMEFNGILTQPDNCVAESVVALQRLYDDKASYNLLSQNSYLYAKDKFTEERFKNEWNNVISSLS